MEKYINGNRMLLPPKKRICLELREKEEKKTSAVEGLPLSQIAIQEVLPSSSKNEPFNSVNRMLLPPKKRICLELREKEEKKTSAVEGLPLSHIEIQEVLPSSNNNEPSKPINNNNDNNDKNIENDLLPPKKRLGNVDEEDKQRKKQRTLPSSESNTNQRTLPSSESNTNQSSESNTHQCNVIEKCIKKSDVDGHQARLAMPGRQIQNKFLTDREDEHLKEFEIRNGKTCRNSIQVKVRPFHSDKVYDMTLSRWNYHDEVGYKYVLNGMWNTFKKDIGLQQGDHIRVVAHRTQFDVLNFDIDVTHNNSDTNAAYAVSKVLPSREKRVRKALPRKVLHFEQLSASIKQGQKGKKVLYLPPAAWGKKGLRSASNMGNKSNSK